MCKPRCLALVIGVWLAVPGFSWGQTSATKPAFGPKGLQSLVQNQVELLRSGEPRVERIVWADGNTMPVPGSYQPQSTYDEKARRLSQKYDWCTVVCDYRQEAGRLHLTITLTNTTDRAMREVHLRVLRLVFPQTPKGSGWYQDLHATAAGVDDVAAAIADYGAGTVVAASETFDPETEISFGKVFGKEVNVYDLKVRPIARAAKDFVHVDQPALAPGKSVVQELSLRFGPAGAGLKDLAGDLFTDYGKKHPPVLKWKDRRPIAMIMVASSGEMHRSATNPRGYLSDPKVDVTTEPGRARFRERLLAQADQCVKVMKGMDSQGGIVWDIEGEQYGEITYVGDPRMLRELAPEMDAIADEYFQRFRDAGLKTGVCIRPSRIVRNEDPNARCPWKHRHMAFDPVDEMADKIALAKKRWGCTLFYMDTNATFAYTGEKDKDGKDKVTSWTMRAQALRRLAEKHPDVLIVPEFQYTGYFSHVSGYRELRGGIASTSSRVLAAYPDAFIVINTGDGKLDERRADLVEAVKRGDVLMFRGWFNSGENAKVQAIYQEAKGK